MRRLQEKLQPTQPIWYDFSAGRLIKVWTMKQNFTLISRIDGLGLSVLAVMPDTQPKAVIQFSHGVCGCKERFLPVMEYMAQRGVACVAGDHRGHGGSIKSPRDLGYMYKGGYKALVDDMRLVTEWVRSKFPHTPLYLLGHSMGSMAARVYVKYDDSAIDGLVICGSPSLQPSYRMARFITGLLCMLGLGHYRMSFSQRITSDRYNRSFAGEGEQAWTCSDPQVRQRFSEMPSCNFVLTANGSYNLMSLMGETYDHVPWAVKNPALPIYFISGEDDPVMITEEKFHKSAQHICDRGYTNVTSAIYPAMRHEVLNEIGKEQVWDDILEFVCPNIGV